MSETVRMVEIEGLIAWRCLTCGELWPSHQQARRCSHQRDANTGPWANGLSEAERQRRIQQYYR